MGASLYDYCIERENFALLQQWDSGKNGTLTPDGVTAGSHKKVWWRCEKGHSWQSAVKERAKGKGCPVCTNKQVLMGYNDLATTHPHIAKQWHPELNDLTPRQVTPGSAQKVWWRCEKGHEWQAAVYSRTQNKNGCPICAGKVVVPGENDLASAFPEIAAQWHPVKNGALKPDGITPYSNRSVWWLCEKGHEYRTAVSHRVRGRKCPYCTNRRGLVGFNDLETLHPLIAAQWHTELNGDLTPQMVTAGSRKAVWWQCEDGHVWKAVVYSRTGKDKSGCPVCAGRTNPQRRELYAEISKSKTR